MERPELTYICTVYLLPSHGLISIRLSIFLFLFYFQEDISLSVCDSFTSVYILMFLEFHDFVLEETKIKKTLLAWDCGFVECY